MVQKYCSQVISCKDPRLIAGSLHQPEPIESSVTEEVLSLIVKMSAETGTAEKIGADERYCCTGNTAICEDADIAPYIIAGGMYYHEELKDMCTRITRRGRNGDRELFFEVRGAGRKAFYTLRKTMPEPIFEITQEIMRLTQLSF